MLQILWSQRHFNFVENHFFFKLSFYDSHIDHMLGFNDIIKLSCYTKIQINFSPNITGSN